MLVDVQQDGSVGKVPDAQPDGLTSLHGTHRIGENHHVHVHTQPPRQ